VREKLKASYSETGRPSIDPELLLRILLIGYLYGITSERKLVEELRMHLAWRWFTGLGFDQEIPHHSTFSKNSLNQCRSRRDAFFSVLLSRRHNWEQRMGQTTSAVSSVRNIGAFQLKVSARGALIRAFFGSTFMYWAVVLSSNPTPLRFSILAVPAVGLIAWAFLRVRATRNPPASDDELAHWRAVRKFYWLDGGLEWGLIGVAVFALARFGRFDLIPQTLGVIIGLHYLPLGKIFRAQQYYWTGGIMVIAALGSLLIPRGHMRSVVGCVAVGLTLWATCFAILCWASSPFVGRNKSNAR